MDEKKLDKLVAKRLKEEGLTADIFTEEEMKQLREEIEAEESGEYMFLDGVLSNMPELMWRQHERDLKNEQNRTDR